MPPERTQRSRQDPVSCDSCRKKKLKCDRTAHCSNCQARSIECSYQGRFGSAIGSTYSAKDGTHPVSGGTSITERLLRLEQAVFGNNTTNAHATDAYNVSHASQHGLKSPVTASHSPAEIEHANGYSEDSRWLENVGSLGSVELPPLHGVPQFGRVDVLSNIVKAVTEGHTCAMILLPTLPEARELFKHYDEHLDALQHVILVPAFQQVISDVFDSLQNARQPKDGHAALTIGILASIAGYWGLGQAPQSLFSSSQDALAVALYWVRCALDCLDHAWRTSFPDLESIQASIVLLFLMYHIEGFSPKLRHLHNSAIVKARDMGMHLTDSPQNKRSEKTQQQIIDTEMRRRVWWHLASTDWSMSLAGSPHEGTYSVHAKYMQVRKPRNITDDDLLKQPADFTRPPHEATANSYYLQRIKLAEVCREAADFLWDVYAAPDLAQLGYDRVIQLDGKFADLLNDPPDILRIDLAHKSVADGVTSGQLMKQSYFTHLTTNVRRTKIHLPYLLRAEQNSRYKFSRDQCLQSARNVIAFRHILPHEQAKLGGPVVLIGVIHHFFCAIMVLVMDVCVNKAEGHEAARKAEVSEACQILENARERSSIANTFLESLLAILRKHGIRLRPDPNAVLAEKLPAEKPPGYSNFQNSSAAPSELPQMQQTYDGVDMAMSTFTDETINFDELWQSYFDTGPEMDPQGWNDLFNDLNRRIDP